MNETRTDGGAGGRPWGLVAEFRTPAELLRAAEGMRDAGYRRWDCHSPFPVHGLDEAMGLRDTKLPWVVLAAGTAGAAVAILMQAYMNTINYPLNISGKPLFSLPAQIPVAFELTVLFSALAAFVGLFLFTGLPRFYHPLFASSAFRRVTSDRFFISVEAGDPRFDAERTERLLRELGGVRVEWMEA